MRTTVTLDADTVALLQAEVARTGLSFKEVLNRALRSALGPQPRQVDVEPLFRAPFPGGIRSFNRAADEWDDDGTLQELRS